MVKHVRFIGLNLTSTEREILILNKIVQHLGSAGSAGRASLGKLGQRAK